MLHYDHDSTVSALNRLTQQTSDLVEQHRLQRPVVPSESMGRDFGYVAYAFQAVFERIHASGERRILDIQNSSVAGRKQVEELTQTDLLHSSVYRGWQK